MKKIISVLLLTALLVSAICVTGCAQINKKEVAVLWSGSGEVESPNSLINALERTMYIENIVSTNYGANGDAEAQLVQAKEAIDRDCAVVAIELINHAMAQEIVDYAKAKNIPVVFFNTAVDAAVVESYDKCVLVGSETSNISDIQGELIADYVKANFKDMDKDEDRDIVAIIDGAFSQASIDKANELLQTEDYAVRASIFEKKFNLTITPKNVLAKEAELIVTSNERYALTALLALQAEDYNTDKLVTQSVPIFTVGGNYDFKSLVLSARPAIPENLVINKDDDKKTIENKNKEIKKLEDLAQYYEKNKYLVDFTMIDESDIAEMVYTTLNVIDTGRITGAAIEDYDAISAAVSAIVRNLIKGQDTFKNVENDHTKVEGSVVKVNYTTYGG